MTRASPESAAWARSVGLTKLQPRWRATISLDVNGEIPKRFPTARSTRFRLVVEESAWSVAVWRHGTCFDYSKTAGARAAIIDDSLALTPPKLSRVLEWLAGVETTLGVEFRRDRPGISSNVKGATKRIIEWLDGS